jgi:PAS domain S-box-containing protein
MKTPVNSSEYILHHQKAVDLIKSKKSKTDSLFSKADRLQIMLEMEAYKIEVESQFEALMLLQEEAARAKEKYRKLYDSAPSGYFTLSRQGQIIELNQSGAKLLDKEREDLINVPFASFVSNDTKPNFNNFLRKVFHSRAKEVCELTLSLEDKLPMFVYLNGIIPQNGKQCLLTMVEIPDHKHVHELLIESEIRYRRLFESAKDGILILNAETGKILAVNPFLIKLLGLSEDQLIDKEIWDVVIFREIVASKDKFLELQHKKYVRYADLPIKTIDGRSIDVEVVCNVYTSDKKKVIQCNIRDITLRKREKEELIKAKEQAEESDRLKTAFLANMSHEIRTPINGIIGFAELLKMPDLDQDSQNQYISIIEKSGDRMLNIINDIINLSKVDSGQMGVSISRTNINDQLDFIYAFFKKEVETKGIKLLYEKNLPDNDAYINTDREKVYAILTNLVKNAIKFTRTGSIEFGCNLVSGRSVTEPEELEFFVKDTGVGIRPDQMNIIFERFRQGSELLSRNYEGAGLGLSISKAYVEILGGKIWTDSLLGQGSTFYFTLPYVIYPENKIQKRKTIINKVMENKINNLKILIAEDDENSEKLLEMFVRKYCVEILIAKTGWEAVDICQKYPELDLVLMDIKMPEMDGYEATRQIRYFNKNLVIFAQTAFAQRGDREVALAAGCNDYISKPISKDLLASMIKKHFQGRGGIKRSGSRIYS